MDTIVETLRKIDEEKVEIETLMLAIRAKMTNIESLHRRVLIELIKQNDKLSKV